MLHGRPVSGLQLVPFRRSDAEALHVREIFQFYAALVILVRQKTIPGSQPLVRLLPSTGYEPFAELTAAGVQV